VTCLAVWPYRHDPWQGPNAVQSSDVRIWKDDFHFYIFPSSMFRFCGPCRGRHQIREGKSRIVIRPRPRVVLWTNRFSQVLHLGRLAMTRGHPMTPFIYKFSDKPRFSLATRANEKGSLGPHCKARHIHFSFVHWHRAKPSPVFSFGTSASSRRVSESHVERHCHCHRCRVGCSKPSPCSGPLSMAPHTENPGGAYRPQSHHHRYVSTDVPSHPRCIVFVLFSSGLCGGTPQPQVGS